VKRQGFSKPSYRLAYRSVKTGRLVSKSFRGKKKQVKIAINYEALRKAGRAASKRASAKRRKKAGPKRSSLARQTGVRSLGKKKRGKTGREFQIYDIPFSVQTVLVNGKRQLEWVPSLAAIKSVFKLEAQLAGDELPSSAATFIEVVFKDREDTWISTGDRILTDEPDAAQRMFEQIYLKINEYDIRELLSIHLHIDPNQ
jgi:hypothetical protein